MKQGQETNQIWTHEAGTHDTTEPWHNSPLPEGVSHAVTVPPGRGGGRSGGPSGQTRTGKQDGTSRAKQADRDHGRAGSSGSHGGAGSSGGHGRWSSGPMASVPFYPPPKKISLGKSGGIRSPPGLGHTEQYMTWQDSRTRQTGQDHPTGTRSPPGRARKLRLLLGMTIHQGPSQGSLSFRFHFHDMGAGG